MVQGNKESNRRNEDSANNVSATARKGSEKVSEFGEKVRSESQRMAANAANEAEGGLASVGKTISGFAETIRNTAPQGEGRFGSAARAVADRLDSGAQYLNQRGINDITGDLSQLVAKHPMQSLFAGVGIGILLGSALSKRH